MEALGIDVGSITTKAVLFDNDGVLVSVIIPSIDEANLSAEAALAEVLQRAGLGRDNNLAIVSTGVGGKAVSFSQQHKSITTCLARGSHYLFPSARMLIDMGAESSSIIKLNVRGRLSDWAGHDKCAAGTGVFLQQMAKLMQMSLADMSALSYQAKSKADISNTCAVFSESEVISHVHRDPPTPKPEIIAGIYYSVVSRIMALCKRIGIEKDVAVSGGVALNRGLVSILEKEFGFEVLVADQPQIVAALGAAIIGRENTVKGGQ